MKGGKFDPRICFLGTASMRPGTFRNVSSILLSYNDDFSLLMDCGEGTLT